MQNVNAGKIQDSGFDQVFSTINYTLLIFVLLLILLPLIFIVSASFSSPQAVMAGRVGLLPSDFSLLGYKAVFEHHRFWIGLKNSLMYTAAGTSFNVVMTIMAAYPLSRPNLVGRRLLIFLFLFTMLFSGGLIPNYLVVQKLGLLNSPAALILPTGIGIFNLLITITFFRTSIPEDLIEASRLDGCNDLRALWLIVLPLSRPIIAVLVLFYAVNHWNSYFSALIYIRDQDLWPLQLVLREVLIQNSVDASMLVDVQEMAAKQGLRELLKYALIVVASAPILALYPFVQKHFVKGMLIGSVK